MIRSFLGVWPAALALWRYVMAAAIALALAVSLNSTLHPAATAQGIVPPSQIAAQVYAQLPNLPLENTYERRDSRDIATDSTLMSRFIRYHLFVQRRSPVYRLDWKLTLADYLGVNEWVTAPEYPGADILETSPRNGDMNAVRSLTLAQRQALVEVLVGIYRPG